MESFCAIRGSHRSDRSLGVALFDSRTPPSVERYQRFVLGLLGTINTSYFMVVAFVAPVLFRRRELWVLAAVALSMGLWFVVDSVSPLAPRSRSGLRRAAGKRIMRDLDERSARGPVTVVPKGDD